MSLEIVNVSTVYIIYSMEQIILDLIGVIREKKKNHKQLDKDSVHKIIRLHNRKLHQSKLSENQKPYAKRQLFSYYKRVRSEDNEKWQMWKIQPDEEKMLLDVITMKPRRTASGVATITVMTKPWPCNSACIFCPNDIRMPKSYLSDEPVCQRAERNYFDPYLQVVSRLKALEEMGHNIDKIELIVLGGTWSDYSQDYQIWYITQLFKALNEADQNEAKKIRNYYKQCGLKNERDEIKEAVQAEQEDIQRGKSTYNQAFKKVYLESEVWKKVVETQKKTWEELEEEQKKNETGQRRVVGLVIETRPDTITVDNLLIIRKLGCTKVQIGVQSLQEEVLYQNHRNTSVEKIKEAFSLLRVFGFKIHAHFMVNLYKQTPEGDKKDYLEFVTNSDYLPDEVKLYPCSLVDGTLLVEKYRGGEWKPYSYDELMSVLVEDTVNTPRYCRISRMIRDISAHDIMAGNKLGNLRQLVENEVINNSQKISEIRWREINNSEVEVDSLKMKVFEYKASIADEYFLEWVNEDDKVVGFLRLSLPKQKFVEENENLPVKLCEAMIREVHVYGKVAKLHQGEVNSQHLGLGKALIKEAEKIAKRRKFNKLNVISSVGTREYYRALGFKDVGLYQQLEMDKSFGE